MEQACFECNKVLALALVKSGQATWNDGFEMACMSGDYEFISWIIEQGIDNWNSGLISCCKTGRTAFVLLMIKNGATNLDEALVEACFTANFIPIDKELIRILINAGAKSFESSLASFWSGAATKTENTDLAMIIIEAAKSTDGCEVHLSVDQVERIYKLGIPLGNYQRLANNHKFAEIRLESKAIFDELLLPDLSVIITSF